MVHHSSPYISVHIYSRSLLYFLGVFLRITYPIFILFASLVASQLLILISRFTDRASYSLLGLCTRPDVKPKYRDVNSDALSISFSGIFPFVPLVEVVPKAFARFLE